MKFAFAVYCGGQKGFWKLGHHVETSSSRPSILFIQEATGDGRWFQIYSQFWGKLGYKTYCGLSEQCEYRGGCKGVITLVACNTKSKRIHFCGHNKAAILAVCTDDLLLVSCYAAPVHDGSSQLFIMHSLEEILRSIHWTRGIVIGGDFNLEFPVAADSSHEWPFGHSELRVTWRFWSFSPAHPDVEWQIWSEEQSYGDCLKATLARAQQLKAYLTSRKGGGQTRSNLGLSLTTSCIETDSGLSFQFIISRLVQCLWPPFSMNWDGKFCVVLLNQEERIAHGSSFET